MAEPIELTEQDKADIAAMTAEAAEAPKYTVLQSWNEVLKSIESSATERITPDYAARVTARWPKLDFKDVPAYNQCYHSLMVDMRDTLEEVLDTDPQAFERIENDAEENRALYLELLLRWNIQVLHWHHEWDVTDDDAAVFLAAIQDVTEFYLGERGLVAHLGQIKFVFGDEDRAELAAKLEAAKAELGE